VIINNNMIYATKLGNIEISLPVCVIKLELQARKSNLISFLIPGKRFLQSIYKKGSLLQK